MSVQSIGEVEVDADTWMNDGDGDLDCWKGKDNHVATFYRGQWNYVHQASAVTRKPRTSLPRPPLPRPPGHQAEDI